MFCNLVGYFEDRDVFPIEVAEVAEVLIQLGCQDEFHFSPEKMDTGKLRGAFYQYKSHAVPYGEPILHTIIVYAEGVDVPWQRVICCKELIHVCDSAAARTNSPEEVAELMDKLLGLVSNEDYGLADFMASVDRLALYQALVVLFPLKMRTTALQAIAASKATEEQIAQWASLPLPLVKLVLSEEWPEVCEVLTSV